MDGEMYPFSSCSLMYLSTASCSFSVRGYILQSIFLGASGMSLISWSHGREGGKRLASSSLNVLAWLWYSVGTISCQVLLTFDACLIAVSVAIVVFEIASGEITQEKSDSPFFSFGSDRLLAPPGR